MSNLKDQLDKVIPPYQRPSNVGPMNVVTWPYYHDVSFDLGTNPTWTSSSSQTRNFQVSQEAGFLLMAVGRNAWDSSHAGDLAPLQIEIRDRQSTRVFNDRPMPIQNIGKKKDPTVFPTPMLIAPNAIIEVIASSWVDSTVSMPTVGIGKFDLFFFGYRIRIEDLNKVQSTVFGGF